jgi:hypothetical protein
MRHISSAILITAMYGCSSEARVTQPDEVLAKLTSVQYEIVKLPSLGGTQSRGMAIKRSPISGSSAG